MFTSQETLTLFSVLIICSISLLNLSSLNFSLFFVLFYLKSKVYGSQVKTFDGVHARLAATPLHTRESDYSGHSR